MEYLADTNIYRNLVRGLNIDQVKNLAALISEKENAKEIKSGLSIVVAMELISHLNPNDKAVEECFMALCLLFHHTKKVDTLENKCTGKFYPPLNVVLTKFFFNEDTEYLNMYARVLDLTMKITENFNIINIYSYSKEIDTVVSQIFFEKNEIKINFENYLKSLNKDVADWEYFKKNKTERREWFKILKNGKTLFFVAESLMIRAFNLTNREYRRNEANYKKLLEFIEQFFPAILMNNLILEQIGHGTISLGDIKDEKWNTINDISIMFGMLIFSDRDNKVLVTEDIDIRTCMIENDMENRVLSLSQFKNIIEIKTV